MNLRKDHCRHLQSRATREPFFNARDTGGAPVRPVARKLRTLGVQPTPGYGAPNKPRRAKRQGTPTIGHAPVALGSSVLGLLFNVIKSKRLSATDISALASMKNVAKCDTWCELQNPVNHRVFERKLRPKPWLRARLPGCHASRCLQTLHPSDVAVMVWMRKLASRGREPRMAQTRAREAKRHGIRWLIQAPEAVPAVAASVPSPRP